MKSSLCLLLLLPLLGMADGTVWQLGIQDNSSKEFQRYSSREFQTSRQLLECPGYDRKTGTLTFRIPLNEAVAAPAMPAALTGATAGNQTPLRKLRLLWQEEQPGFRELEFRIIYAADRNFRGHRVTPNENMDIDGMTWVEAGVRVAAPGNRMLFQAVPCDVEQFLEKRGEPLTVRLSFPVKAGENVLELAETSGSTYGRVFHFDYLKLSSSGADRRPAPYGEFRAHENFLNSSIYRVGDPARVGLEFHNLEPGRTYSTEVSFVDYRGNVVLTRGVKLEADADGFARAAAAVPENLSGHFRVRAASVGDGAPPRETRIAAVRQIEPLSAAETEMSFIGFSGLDLGVYFPPEAGDPDSFREKFAEYACWQKILQVRHERIHSLCWHFVEPSEHRYFWEPWDQMIESQTAGGIRVQLTLLGTPKWLMDRHFPGRKYSHIAEHCFAPPPDMDKWREFCTLVARRYGDRIHEFEIWNEVSEQSLFWPKGNARQYVDLVRNASEAIKAVCPEAKIVAETVWPRQEEFIRQLFGLGIARYVDVHADHYITDARILNDAALIGKYAPGAPLISNESKMESAGNPLGQVDEASRRAAAETLIRNALYANSHGFRRIYNFVIAGGTWRKWGIVGPDNTPKYTFSALKTLLNRTAGAKFESYHRLSGTLELFLYRYVTAGRAEANGGEYLAVFCNSSARPERLLLPTLAEKCRVIDLMDNAEERSAPERILELEVDSAPVMLTGIDVAALDELAKLEITQGNGDLRPGEPVCLEIALPAGTCGGTFSVLRSDGVQQQMRLMPGERRFVSLTTGAELLNSVATVKVSGEIGLPGRRLPVLRYLEYIIDETPAGVSLLPPPAPGNWRTWGSAKAKFHSGRAEVAVTGPKTGALTAGKPLKVTPGAHYLLDFQAKGAGILRVMGAGYDREGKSRVLSHNLLSERLTEQWNGFRYEWRCPADIVKLELHFYEYGMSGNFELSNLKFIRLRDNAPVNRQLYKAEAVPFPAPADGRQSVFPAGAFQEVADRAFLQENPENPVTAAFAVAADTRNLHLAVRVRDKVHQEGPDPEQLWQGDSVQVDFDLSDGTKNVRTVQFGFALLCGKPVAYRYRTLPAEDIVPAYCTGEAPSGVKAGISRSGDETFYEVTIPVEAIHPQLSLQPGMRMGFSLLVNQNDGSGRLGFLQWSSGIGRERDSREFGELTLPDKL